MKIPVISLHRPWANWVSLVWKPIETRTHERFRGLVGKRIGIHASLKWDSQWEQLAGPYLKSGQIEMTKDFLQLGGAIIATALVADFSKLDWSFSQGALIDCELTERWGLFLSDLQHPEAIPCKGRQGIWYHEVPEIGVPA